MESNQDRPLATPDPDRAGEGTEARSVTPEQGRTVLAHVQELLAEAALIIARARGEVQLSPQWRLRPVDRERLRRDLAGVISKCETVRIWLDAGAPQ